MGREEGGTEAEAEVERRRGRHRRGARAGADDGTSGGRAFAMGSRCFGFSLLYTSLLFVRDRSIGWLDGSDHATSNSSMPVPPATAEGVFLESSRVWPCGSRVQSCRNYTILFSFGWACANDRKF